MRYLGLVGVRLQAAKATDAESADISASQANAVSCPNLHSAPTYLALQFLLGLVDRSLPG